jgi:hypothetical protein
VCFANTNGGTLFIGLNEDPSKPVPGVTNPEQVVAQLRKDITDKVTPPLVCTVDVHEAGGKKICGAGTAATIRLMWWTSIKFTRDEADTEWAVRDGSLFWCCGGGARRLLRSKPKPARSLQPAWFPGQPGARPLPGQKTRAGVEGWSG